MKYDELLNHKTILDCENPRDEEQHGKDINSMYAKLGQFGVYGAIVKMQPMDKAHKKEKARFLFVRNDEYVDVVQGCDIKNGGDMVVHEGLFGIAAYGGNYTYGLRKEHHMVETLCSFKFLDKEADFERLEEMDSSELKKEFEEGGHFLDSKGLIWELRDVKRKDLDTLIREADEKRGGKDKDKDKEKDKDKDKGRDE